MFGFVDMADELATLDDFSVAGVLTPVGGTAVPIRLLISRNDEASPLLKTHVRHGGWTAAIRTSGVPARPPELSVLQVAEGRHAGNYKILDAEVDREGLFWRCGLAEAA